MAGLNHEQLQQDMARALGRGMIRSGVKVLLDSNALGGEQVTVCSQCQGEAALTAGMKLSRDEIRNRVLAVFERAGAGVCMAVSDFQRKHVDLAREEERDVYAVLRGMKSNGEVITHVQPDSSVTWELVPGVADDHDDAESMARYANAGKSGWLPNHVVPDCDTCGHLGSDHGSRGCTKSGCICSPIDLRDDVAIGRRLYDVTCATRYPGIECRGWDALDDKGREEYVLIATDFRAILRSLYVGNAGDVEGNGFVISDDGKVVNYLGENYYVHDAWNDAKLAQLQVAEAEAKLDKADRLRKQAERTLGHVCAIIGLDVDQVGDVPTAVRKAMAEAKAQGRATLVSEMQEWLHGDVQEETDHVGR